MWAPGLDNLPHLRNITPRTGQGEKKKKLKSELKIDTTEVLTNENK